MALAIFDLDNTLLAGDSDYLWGCFLAERGLVDGDEYQRLNEEFYRDYHAGCLDIRAFLRFALRPLRNHALSDLLAWRAAFIAEVIEPVVLPRALGLVDDHRRRGDVLLIITATNEFVTAPIAARFGIENLIATVPEQAGGRFTGEVEGIPAFQEGKVRRLEAWLESTSLSLAGSSFYSDSRNDLPLLERVANPVAVDPDPVLRAQAAARAWPIISLRANALEQGALD